MLVGNVVCHDNIGKISKEENTKYYIENYYDKVLKNLNPHEVAKELGDNAVLLCYEKPGDFCHRQLVAKWFRDAGIEIAEINFKNGVICEIEIPKI